MFATLGRNCRAKGDLLELDMLAQGIPPCVRNPHPDPIPHRLVTSTTHISTQMHAGLEKSYYDFDPSGEPLSQNPDRTALDRQPKLKKMIPSRIVVASVDQHNRMAC